MRPETLVFASVARLLLKWLSYGNLGVALALSHVNKTLEGRGGVEMPLTSP